MNMHEFFNWLFSLKGEQILFVILFIVLSVFLKKMYETIEKKDAKILELIDKVNATQIEIVKTMENFKSQNDNDRTMMLAEFKLLRTLIKNIEDKLKKIGE